MLCATILDGTLLLPDGASEAFALKAWPGPGSECLRWELRRILPLAGYQARTHRSKVCNVFSQQQEKWSELAAWHGWAAEGCFGRSVTSSSSRRRVVAESEKASGQKRPAVEDAESEYWMDTKMFLAAMVWWAANRRDSQHRERCRVALQTVLQLTCPPASVGDDLFQPTVADKEQCRIGSRDESEVCACLEGVLGTLPALRGGSTPQSICVDKIAALCQTDECVAVGQLTRRVLERLARCMCQHFGQWKAEDFLKCSSLVLEGQSKRRRMDAHAKGAIIQEFLQAGRADKASTLVKALRLSSTKSPFAWMEEGLATLQAAARQGCPTVGLAYSCGLESMERKGSNNLPPKNSQGQRFFQP